MSGKLTSLLASQDMTQGSPSGNLIRFSVPLLIGNLAQQLYSTVDSLSLIHIWPWFIPRRKARPFWFSPRAGSPCQ